MARGQLGEPPLLFSAIIAEFESFPEGRDALQLTYMSAVKLANELFEDDRMREVLLEYRFYKPFAYIRTNCDGSYFAIRVNSFGEGWVTSIGGSGKLYEALANCIKALGGYRGCGVGKARRCFLEPNF